LRAGRPACDSLTRPSATATTTLALADKNATSRRTRVEGRRATACDYLEVHRPHAQDWARSWTWAAPANRPAQNRVVVGFTTAAQSQMKSRRGPNGVQILRELCDAPPLQLSHFAGKCDRGDRI
jgi:hypothetical protein